MAFAFYYHNFFSSLYYCFICCLCQALQRGHRWCLVLRWEIYLWFLRLRSKKIRIWFFKSDNFPNACQPKIFNRWMLMDVIFNSVRLPSIHLKRQWTDRIRSLRREIEFRILRFNRRFVKMSLNIYHCQWLTLIWISFAYNNKILLEWQLGEIESERKFTAFRL